MLHAARALGFTHYNLTEHVPRAHADALYPEEREANVTPADLGRTFESYLVEARRCAAEFAALHERPLRVLVGAELENIDARSDESLLFNDTVLRDNATGAWRVDYVVGSVHHVHGIPIDFDRATYETALLHMLSEADAPGSNAISLDDRSTRLRAHYLLMLAYFDTQLALFRHSQPEVVGHFDLCRLYELDTPMTLAANDARPEGERIPSDLRPLLADVDAAVHRNVAFAVQYGALFELNSASVRKGWPTPYPAEDVLNVILAYNGRLCLSDDAHSHEQVGLNYRVVRQYLIAKSVDAVWLLEKPGVPGIEQTFVRGAVARRVLLSEIEEETWPQNASF